jgi:hypothetical protein
MTAENQQIFDLFCKARPRSLLRRATLSAQATVYRQTLFGNLGLADALAFGMI